MIRLIQAAQEHLGAVGTGVTVGSGFLGWVTKAIPVLQALSLFVSVLVGVATLIWYFRSGRIKGDK